MHHQYVEDDVKDTRLEDLGCSLHLAEEKLERIKGHALRDLREQASTSRRLDCPRTLAMRQHRPRLTSPFCRSGSSLRLTAGMISSPRIPSSVEFSSKVYNVI